jgi:phytoene/squalene synthetase
MLNPSRILDPNHQPQKRQEPDLAAAITKASSRQTYYTIRFLVDRELVPDAYRAYAYFRWVDDCVDTETGSRSEKIAFVNRQQTLLDACYRQETPDNLCTEEQMLVDLVKGDTTKESGLQSYLRNMMGVMTFDAERRGRLISQAELTAYSDQLATAVTEALLYFIGHRCLPPCDEARYLAVRGAHVVHMLRDLREDNENGYFNIPLETIQAFGLTGQEMEAPSYQKWVSGRVKLAWQYFQAGREYILRVKSFRCRLAGFAYIARFEWMAQTIQREGYRLRLAYPERKSLRAGLWMVWRTLLSLSGWNKLNMEPVDLPIQPVQIEKQ